MANKSTFQGMFNSLVSGLFKTNTTKDIGSDDMRALVDSIVANNPFTDDDSYTWASPLISISGTTTLTGTASPVITAYTSGQTFKIKAASTSVGSVTLNLNSVGAKKLFINPTTQAGSGQVIQNTIYVVVYDATLDTATGGFLMIGLIDRQNLDDVLSIGNDAGAQRIENLLDPVDPQDADTMAARDAAIVAAIDGFQWKVAARVASTADVATLSGLLTIDGVTLVAADRVLLKDQSDQTENGIYEAASGAWSRTTDADVGSEIDGAAITVTAGTVNADTTWVQITNSVTVGASNIVWTQLGSQTPDATETVKGKAEIATQVETDAGADDTRFITPLKLKTYIDDRNQFRGAFDATGTDVYPTAGTGSGISGAILAGDEYVASPVGDNTDFGGTLTLKSIFKALVDTPGSTASNWRIY